MVNWLTGVTNCLFDDLAIWLLTCIIIYVQEKGVFVSDVVFSYVAQCPDMYKPFHKSNTSLKGCLLWLGNHWRTIVIFMSLTLLLLNGVYWKHYPLTLSTAWVTLWEKLCRNMVCMFKASTYLATCRYCLWQTWISNHNYCRQSGAPSRFVVNFPLLGNWNHFTSTQSTGQLSV